MQILSQLIAESSSNKIDGKIASRNGIDIPPEQQIW